MSTVDAIAIVGAGQAAASAIAALRQNGFEGRLTVIGEEPVPPYQRPPLSKKYLLGQMDKEQLELQSAAFYSENNVDLRLGVRATEIRRDDKQVVLSDGSTVAWDKLLLTTGAVPRRLPEKLTGGFEHVYTIRTIADVDAVSAKFSRGKRVLIVGGGYIGLEAAAVARGREVDTVLIEALPRILMRVAAEDTARLLDRLHRDHGVDLRDNTTLEGMTPNADGTCTVSLSGGAEIEVDFVIVGIGVDPDAGLASAAGLSCDGGIQVDEYCRTTDHDIYAAGDCTVFPYHGRRIRLESVQNAIDQAAAAATNMVGDPEPYAPVPWFWSDQYDVKLQMVGLNQGHDQTVARDGAREGARSIWYFQEGEFLALDAINDPGAMMVAKRLLQLGISPDPDQIADPEFNLKTLIKGAAGR